MVCLFVRIRFCNELKICLFQGALSRWFAHRCLSLAHTHFVLASLSFYFIGKGEQSHTPMHM